MNKGCGNCLYHGDSKADENGSRIFCMYDNFWYKDTYFCEKWTEYSYHLTNEHQINWSKCEPQSNIYLNSRRKNIWS